MNGGVADDDKNWFFLEFKGGSSDTLPINLAGAGHYDGTAGLIKNNATNTTNIWRYGVKQVSETVLVL